MLSAPLWSWPVLFACVLPVFSWQLRKTVTRSAIVDQTYSLYIEESEWNFEQAQQVVSGAVKGAAKTQLGIMRVTERLAEVAQQLEKLKYIVALGDPCMSAICGSIVLVLAVASSAVIRLLSTARWWGCLRTYVWLAGSCQLLPRSLRQMIGRARTLAQELHRQYFGQVLQQRMGYFWQRLPDAIEASHVHLCERFVYEPSPPRTS